MQIVTKYIFGTPPSTLFHFIITPRQRIEHDHTRNLIFLRINMTSANSQNV